MDFLRPLCPQGRGVLFLYANTEEKEKEKIKIEAPILLPFEPWLPNFLLLSTILCRV